MADIDPVQNPEPEVDTFTDSAGHVMSESVPYQKADGTVGDPPV